MDSTDNLYFASFSWDFITPDEGHSQKTQEQASDLRRESISLEAGIRSPREAGEVQWNGSS